MNMLNAQAAELRKMAAAMSERGSAIGLDYGMGRELVDAARMMREAADTIDKLDVGTCKMEYGADMLPECGNCHEPLVYYTKRDGFDAKDKRSASFCPRCGTKVVDE